jgi:3-oxoadipate enol-lactonase
VAQALALLHPRSVDHLVLGSTWPLPRPYEELCPDARRLGELRRGLPATAEELATWFFPEAFLQQRPELRRLFANARPESARSARRLATVQTTLERGVADIVSPTLVLAGELDRVVPPGVTLSMADRIRGADVVLLPATGHVAAVQAPQVLARHIVRFLDPEGVKL